MQKGSIIRSSRRQGPDVWEYRWRESCPGEKRKHRRIVIGSVDTLRDESSALKAITALRREINLNDARLKVKPLALAELVEHYRQRELTADNEWKTLSTRVTYEGYLRKWIVPRWGASNISAIRAVEVELWLRTLPLARGSRAKIRNLMSVLFNHGRRHDFIDRNPINLVRQSAKRRTQPEVLLPSEINRLARGLRDREKTLVLLAAGTGLRMSELFGLKWRDIDFTGQQISVLRSIVKQTVGPCKTEASQKPVPLDPHLVRTLRAWRRCARFRQSTDWVFASLATQGRLPLWGQALMRHYIRPAALKLGITKRIGWRTFRHSYSTLLKANGADIKVMQELLRHASSLTIPLREEPILNLGEFHGRRAFFVVVGYVVDPGAHGIAAHQPGIERFQQFGRHTHIPHPRIEPQVVAVGVEDDGHSVVDR
jgi:integrase